MDSLYNDTINITNTIFGTESIAITSNILSEAVAPIALSNCLNFKILTIILFLTYTYFIYYFKGYIKSCITAIFRPRILNKLMEEQSYIFDSFMKFLIISGIVTLTLCSLKILEILAPTITLEYLSNVSINLKIIVLLSLILLIFIFRISIIYIVGKLTNSEGFARCLVRYLNLNLITSTLILMPLYLLLYQSFGIWQTILLCLITIILILMIFLLFFNSYILFIKQKVSILYWFLYLCAVEFLPISLLILIVCKKLQLY